MILLLDWMREPLNRYKLWIIPFLDKWNSLDNIQEKDIENLNFLESEDDFKRVVFDSIKGNHEKIPRIAIKNHFSEASELRYEDGNNICHIASKSGNVSVIKAIDDQMQKIKGENGLELVGPQTIFSDLNNRGQNCLHLAGTSGQFESFEALLKWARKSNQNMHVVDKFGFYPLAYLIQHEIKAPIRCVNPWIRILKQYKKMVPDTIEIANENTGDTLMHVAIKSKNVVAVKALLTEQSQDNLANLRGVTPLHICAKNGLQVEANLLVKKESQSFQDHEGQTPLHYLARYSGSVQTFQALQPTKEAIEALNMQGKSSLMYAEENGFSKLCSAMKEIIDLHLDNENDE